MACITLAPPVAVTTIQLTRTMQQEAAPAWQMEFCPQQCNSLRMSWVVVTDNDGSRRLRMQWASDDQ